MSWQKEEKITVRSAENVVSVKRESVVVRLKKTFSWESVARLQSEGKDLVSIVAFFGLVSLFLIERVLSLVAHLPGLRRVLKVKSDGIVWKAWQKVVLALEARPGNIRRSVLIALAFRNMRVKKTRAMVTVGGMSMGIAAIVFLVSLGYGVQNLVVSRVARLDELKMADVTLGQAANIRLNDETMEVLARIPNVEEVMPTVSLVGKVMFEGGVGETVVYGVTGDYLSEASGLTLKSGEFFRAEAKSYRRDEQIAGAQSHWNFESAKYGQKIGQVIFNLEPEIYLPVRSEPGAKGEILGYVKRIEGELTGVEFWGEQYLGDERGEAGMGADGRVLGRWIKAPYPLWEKGGSDYTVLYDGSEVQEWREGYITQIGIEIIEQDKKLVHWDEATDHSASRFVLGESSSATPASSLENSESSISAVVVGRDESGVEWVTLGGEEGATEPEIMYVELAESAVRQAVVNTAFVELLGLDVLKAVGTGFDIGFVILNTLNPDLVKPTESKPEKYVISAVVDSGTAPILYVPLSDITSLGVNNYSQAKVVVNEKANLSQVRRQIETMGLATGSVADTLAQIDSLFGTIRMVLASFGLVALTVASLGMFNTLTVSLMERTREVGVMKAMGMSSGEVKELFLAEAMIMGLLGGLLGIGMGWAFGKILSVVLSLFAVWKGVGFVDVAYIPWGFALFVLTLSFVVGVLTGVYPAKRAKKISALNALRYE